MKLYDAIIRETLEEAELSGVKRFAAAGTRPWPDEGKSELVMLRDAAFELGGSGQPSANYTLVTTEPAPRGDEILLCGPDLPEIRSDVPFARIVILETEELPEDDAGHDRIRELEYVRYHVYPKGYMVRVSATSFEEQVRVSREAARKGISFATVGRTYIDRYRAVAGVRSVRLLFITKRELVEKLKPNAKKADDITKTLSHILDGLPTDCGHCSLKSVCDEVEGMREMHMGQKGAKK